MFRRSKPPPSLVFALTLTLTATLLLTLTEGNEDAKRLYDDVLGTYNKLVRPVENNSDTLRVYIGLQLNQLLKVDERNQIMTTIVWLRQQWIDYRLQWDPDEYGGVTVLYVPSNELWLPDIVLHNNADGDYQVTRMTKATVNFNGTVLWEPPAVYKSSCEIDVEYFPFDMQMCHMKFSPWAHNAYQLELHHQDEVPQTNQVDIGIDLTRYYRSVEWDVLAVPADRKLKYYPCCPEPYYDVYFNITLRRKPLFYTVNLIIPSVGMAFLTCLVFYLPSGSREKVGLSITLLLSLTVFFLLLVEIIPPTSHVIPLIGKYLLFTFVLMSSSILATVFLLNIHFRSSRTHRMSPWVKWAFMEMLPRVLFVKRPIIEKKNILFGVEKRRRNAVSSRYQRQIPGTVYENHIRPSAEPEPPPDGLENLPPPLRSAGSRRLRRSSRELHPDVLCKAMDGVLYIERHLKDDDVCKSTKEDWKYMAMVLDRLFLWIFGVTVSVGTYMIIFRAPMLYDQTRAIDAELSHNFKT